MEGVQFGCGDIVYSAITSMDLPSTELFLVEIFKGSMSDYWRTCREQLM